MSLGRWLLGAVAAGLALGAASAQAGPMPIASWDDQGSVQQVQFFFDEAPPPVYYDAPPRRYYDDYPPPPRGYRAPPPRGYYAPPPGRGGRYGNNYNNPPGRYGNNNPRRQPPQYYSKDQVRAWNRANGW